MDPASYYAAAAAAAAAASRGPLGYPPHQGYAYPQQPGVPGMQPQYQQPLRLARYPADALHGAPPPGMVGQYPPPGLPMGGTRPLQPQLAPMGRPAGAPQMMQMAGQMAGLLQGYGQQPQQGNPYGPPRPYGGMGGPMGAMMQLPGQVQHLQPGQQPYSVPASGAATPKAPGSGMHTPVHPHQHSRVPSASGGLAGLQAQPVPGPPGVNLPDSLLSPTSPGAVALRQPASPGSRAQSAHSQQLAPLRAAPQHHHPQQQGASSTGGYLGLASSGSGSPNPPPGAAAGFPPKANGGLSRAGSAHSTTASTRGGRTGSLGGGSGGRLGSGKLGSAPASRVGSAGKRSVVGELDEFDNIKVAVRVRPPNAQELARADQQALFVNPNDYRQIQLAVPGANGTTTARNFTFHACLGPASRQHDVVRLCGINQLLDAALDGFNATIMCYGQTGSGKTYTMSGREEVIMDDGYMGDSDDGIMTRTAVYLFEQMQRRNDGCKYSFRVSYLEIYNEAVYDLLKFDKKQLQVRWEPTKGFHVPELHVKECHTLEDLLRAISRGMRHRRVGSHELNLESSRSHSIMTIYCDCTPLRADDHEYGTTRFGKVSLVDLAGSERVRDSKSSGETLKETTNINRSLFMLGKVISSLAEGAQGARVPYRDSKLTRLLMDSLGGSSLSLVIACCSPSAAHVEETLSTLTYASRAKNIRNQPIQQVDPQEAAISALKREVRLLRAENTYLREQLFQANLPRGPPAPTSRLHSSHGAPPPPVLPPEAAALGGLAPAQQPASGMAPPLGPGMALGAEPPASAFGAAAAARMEPTGGAAEAAGQGRAGASRPPSAGRLPGEAGSVGAAAGAALSAAQASNITSEELLRRLLETQRMLVQFSRENDRLSGENDRLRAGKNLVATDYQGALEEVEWLRTKLESLETSLLRASFDSGTAGCGAGAGAPAAPAAGSPARAKLLEAARAAVEAGEAGGQALPGPAAAAPAGPGEAGGLEGATLGARSPPQQVGPAEEERTEEMPAAPGVAVAEPRGAKLPLIPPELLRDPSSELVSVAGGTAQPQLPEAAVWAAALAAGPQEQQEGPHQQQQLGGAASAPPAGEQLLGPSVAAPSASLAASPASEDIEGAEGLLPAGEPAAPVVGESPQEAAGLAVEAGAEGAAAEESTGVTARVTLVQPQRKAPVAWVAGVDVEGQGEGEGERQADTIAAAAEKLQQLAEAAD